MHDFGYDGWLIRLSKCPHHLLMEKRRTGPSYLTDRAAVKADLDLIILGTRTEVYASIVRWQLGTAFIGPWEEIRLRSIYRKQLHRGYEEAAGNDHEPASSGGER